jgi:murein DD-endopeptidase MepM/ murein hydrolase activator NlpD
MAHGDTPPLAGSARRRVLRRTLVPMLATVIVVGGSVVGVAASGDGARLLAAHTAVEDLRRDVDRATAVVRGLRERVALVGTDLSDLRDLLNAARAELKIRERTLDRRAELAAEVVTTVGVPDQALAADGSSAVTGGDVNAGDPTADASPDPATGDASGGDGPTADASPGPAPGGDTSPDGTALAGPTGEAMSQGIPLRQLREPLRVVNDAIRASDELAIELLGQQERVEEQVAQVRRLLARVRETEYRLATQERAVRAELADATRSAFDLAEGSASPALQQAAAGLIDRARAELHEIDLAALELRQREAEVLEQSLELDERAAEIRDGIREARRTTNDLYAQMAVAEVIVGERMAAFADPFDGMTDIAIEGILRVCPVDEPRVYSDNWHAPRWGGGFHLHQGIDIFAPTGTPIRAPFDGLAVTADNSLGGIAVKVYGKTGYVYNAHLSAYGELGRVKAGDIIGFVGSTGNASGPHDHFEYHPGDGDAINPFALLNAVC